MGMALNQQHPFGELAGLSGVLADFNLTILSFIHNWGGAFKNMAGFFKITSIPEFDFWRVYCVMDFKFNRRRGMSKPELTDLIF